MTSICLNDQMSEAFADTVEDMRLFAEVGHTIYQNGGDCVPCSITNNIMDDLSAVTKYARITGEIS